jgi:hypothetical protein
MSPGAYIERQTGAMGVICARLGTIATDGPSDQNLGLRLGARPCLHPSQVAGWSSRPDSLEIVPCEYLMSTGSLFGTPKCA